MGANKKSQGRKVRPGQLTHQNKYAGLVEQARQEQGSHKTSKGLDTCLSDGDTSGVKETGLYWEYNQHKFLQVDYDPKKGFDKVEVRVISPQLPRLWICDPGRSVLVNGIKESFYVDISGSNCVTVSYTEYVDSDGKTQYAYRRTNVESEVLGLRPRK